MRGKRYGKEKLEQKLTFDDQVIEKLQGSQQTKFRIISLDGNMFSEFTDKLTQGTDKTKGIEADVGEKQVAIKMDATIEYGKSAETIFKEVSSRVQKALREMTGLNLVKFEMHINNVKLKKNCNKIINRRTKNE